MSDASAALGTDRLPWLEDERAPRARRGPRDLALWASLAVVLVAGASYWMGSQSNRGGSAPAAGTATTVPLPSAQTPAPRPVEPAPQPQLAPVVEPEVGPMPEPQALVAPQRHVRERQAEHRQKPVTRESASAEAQSAEAAAVSETVPPAPAPAPVAVPAPLKPWPAWQSQGARGRIVRIGAFGTRFEAKLGWRYMVRAFPAVAHLKATVVETRNSRGRPFYRFQIGTTSQAHSEVLCQRMEKIRLSCAVVGLPWKPKGVER
jgi:hypothetical protein